MKRVSGLLLAIALLIVSACAGDALPVYENADIIVRCPSLCSFKDVPSPTLAGEAICVYRKLYPGTVLSDAEIYSLIFEYGEFFGENFESEALDAVYTVESTIVQTDGTLKLSLRTEIDWGDGYDFGNNFDLYINSSTGRITRVFLPD